MKGCCEVKITQCQRRSVLLSGIGGLLSLGIPRDAVAGTKPEPTLGTLLAGFANSPGFEARFEERKTISLLTQPLVNYGSIYFQRPDRFARVVRRPNPSKLTLNGRQLTLQSGTGAAKRLELGSRPELSSMLSGIVAVLGGDVNAVRQHFFVDLGENLAGEGSSQSKTQGATPAISLTLRPRLSGVQKLLKELKFEFKAGRLETLSIFEASGDKSVTRFFDFNGKRRFSSEEALALFGAPG